MEKKMIKTIHLKIANISLYLDKEFELLDKNLLDYKSKQ